MRWGKIMAKPYLNQTPTYNMKYDNLVRCLPTTVTKEKKSWAVLLEHAHKYIEVIKFTSKLKADAFAKVESKNLDKPRTIHQGALMSDYYAYSTELCSDDLAEKGNTANHTLHSIVVIPLITRYDVEDETLRQAIELVRHAIHKQGEINNNDK